MRTKSIRLPNGFTVPTTGEFIQHAEIRKLGGEEEDLLMDKDEQKKGNVLFRILKRCLVGLGTVTSSKLIEDMFDRHLLLADLTYLLVELRAWGVGPVYRFEHQCPACETISAQRIDLNTLKVKERDRQFRGMDQIIGKLEDAPKPFDASGMDLPESEWSYGDVEFIHRPLTVADQRMLEAVRADYPKDRATRELFLNVKLYDGHEPTVSAFKKLESATRNEMRRQIEESIGGIDTDVSFVCGNKKCGKTYKDTLPVDMKSFFFQAGDSSETKTATPFRADGETLSCWRTATDGRLKTSESSTSKSAPTTSSAP